MKICFSIFFKRKLLEIPIVAERLGLPLLVGHLNLMVYRWAHKPLSNRTFYMVEKKEMKMKIEMEMEMEMIIEIEKAE